MSDKRSVEVFSAGCGLCRETIEMVKSMACPSCAVKVLDMNDAEVAQRARDLGVKTVPAVVIDDKVSDCCTGHGPAADALKAAGLGRPLP